MSGSYRVGSDSSQSRGHSFASTGLLLPQLMRMMMRTMMEMMEIGVYNYYRRRNGAHAS